MANKRFIPKDKEGKGTPYMKTTFEDIKEWLDENGTREDKRRFAEDYIRTDEDGNETTHWLEARRAFFERFAPDFLPVGTKQPKKADLIRDWL